MNLWALLTSLLFFFNYYYSKVIRWKQKPSRASIGDLLISPNILKCTITATWNQHGLHDGANLFLMCQFLHRAYFSLIYISMNIENGGYIYGRYDVFSLGYLLTSDRWWRINICTLKNFNFLFLHILYPQSYWFCPLSVSKFSKKRKLTLNVTL